MLLDGSSDFELAVRLRSGGATLGELFSFMSGLYFRGKLAYAREFARPPGGQGVLVITPARGLVAADTVVSLAELREIARVPIELGEPRYREPLVRDAERLAATLTISTRVVLLGSVATDKYIGPLSPVFGPRLFIPAEFVGRGDMSRGGLMLRCVESGEELSYVTVTEAGRRGSRPPRLSPRRRQDS
ncbi:MAG: hypothetical protein GWN99_09065 [Gemmatimonadetes bacterium]|uniref:Uncharacterized protein n=1 Tax=Candidatus Kutchimonas denitrificans TaxID=3056748 RepID=A0AAE4ZB09_9BACT|nr:hypothetical protein [Gemmatimonadota bacterium]NIR76714.1 hypothetical protein [Candidatus Kutchimonas denitrificans]NIS01201.1 hypothetical protein [Gemmatimonadota bacterium]NIT68240.1 hypothetical protein [Gemmatimonadota bacterium]NIW75458.1 hypothetical protein [Gemmatimonadota bacterium]